MTPFPGAGKHVAGTVRWRVIARRILIAVTLTVGSSSVHGADLPVLQGAQITGCELVATKPAPAPFSTEYTVRLHYKIDPTVTVPVSSGGWLWKSSVSHSIGQTCMGPAPAYVDPRSTMIYVNLCTLQGWSDPDRVSLLLSTTDLPPRTVFRDFPFPCASPPDAPTSGASGAPPAAQATMMVHVEVWPPTVARGQRAEVSVRALSDRGEPISSAEVVMTSGGGQFQSSGSTRSRGQTDNNGFYRDQFSCDPCPAGYVGDVKVYKPGFSDAQASWSVSIR